MSLHKTHRRFGWFGRLNQALLSRSLTSHANLVDTRFDCESVALLTPHYVRLADGQRLFKPVYHLSEYVLVNIIDDRIQPRLFRSIPVSAE